MVAPALATATRPRPAFQVPPTPSGGITSSKTDGPATFDAADADAADTADAFPATIPAARDAVHAGAAGVPTTAVTVLVPAAPFATPLLPTPGHGPVEARDVRVDAHVPVGLDTATTVGHAAGVLDMETDVAGPADVVPHIQATVGVTPAAPVPPVPVHVADTTDAVVDGVRAVILAASAGGVRAPVHEVSPIPTTPFVRHVVKDVTDAVHARVDIQTTVGATPAAPGTPDAVHVPDAVHAGLHGVRVVGEGRLPARLRGVRAPLRPRLRTTARTARPSRAAFPTPSFPRASGVPTHSPWIALYHFAGVTRKLTTPAKNHVLERQ